MKKKVLSGLMAAAMLASMSTAAFAEEITTAGEGGTTPVTLTTEAAVFSVTVPTVLPIHVDKDGNVTCAQDGVAKIVNNSHGSVEVTNIEIFGKNGWETANYDTVDMTKVQVGTKLLAFMVNGEKTTGADTNTFTASNHDVSNGANAADDLDEMVITYDAIVAPQAAALTDAEVANVVFTIGWDAQ